MKEDKKAKLDELVQFIESNPIVYQTYKKQYETDKVNPVFFESYSIEDMDTFITTWSRFMK
jgi:hypothetical protein